MSKNLILIIAIFSFWLYSYVVNVNKSATSKSSGTSGTDANNTQKTVDTSKWGVVANDPNQYAENDINGVTRWKSTIDLSKVSKPKVYVSAPFVENQIPNMTFTEILQKRGKA